MEIFLAQSAGFCDGVKRAYEMVNNLDMEAVKNPVCILGALVHNPDVARKVEDKGILKISFEELLNSENGNIGTLIVTAHGAGPDIFAVAEKKGIEVIDTTCPKVVKVQRLAQVFRKRGYEVILVGDKKHKEVEGIYEWGGKKAQIISDLSEFSAVDVAAFSKVAVISQTTQDEDFFKEVAEFVKSQAPQAEILSTICHATHDRQKEVKRLARQYEAVIIIGSDTSANSTRLFEISKKLNPKTFFVENASGINLKNFSEVKSIAVTAGASTPEWVIKEVLDLLFSHFKL
ncbi:MAG: 4-hydroxy-3-methylbut-2-enyl diphosphate reductase [Parcubacteria group bacterium]